MLISPIKFSNNVILPKLAKKSHTIKNAALGLTLCASSFLPTSCYYSDIPVTIEESVNEQRPIRYSDDIILPDTVNQPIIQDIKDIHERINTVFTSLNIIEPTKNINDIKSVEFEDADNNKYNFSDISQTDKGFEFHGKVNAAGVEKDASIKFSDGAVLVDRPLVCMETTFNRKHHLSMIYQNRWRLGKDRSPERRIFQNRTNKDVDSIDRREYYPYDAYNIFALRRTENGISSKVTNNKYVHSADDEIKNLKVTYK